MTLLGEDMKPIQSIPEDQRARYAATAIHGATYHELDESNAALSSSLDETLQVNNMLQRDWLKLHRENKRLRTALERINRFPVHSEPVGGAYAMRDIAHEALSPYAEAERPAGRKHCDSQQPIKEQNANQ